MSEPSVGEIMLMATERDRAALAEWRASNQECILLSSYADETRRVQYVNAATNRENLTRELALHFGVAPEKLERILRAAFSVVARAP